jgi:hypothetical protein
MIMINYTKKECESKIDVEKMVRGENVCYSTIPRDLSTYNAADISASFSHDFEVYTLSVNKSLLSNIKQITLITHFVLDKSDFRIPINSKQYGERVIRSIEDNIIISVYFQKISYKLLPPPADTQCIYGFNQEVNYSNCMSAELEKVNRYPWSVFIEEGSQKNMSILSDLDLEQQCMRNAFRQAKKKCGEFRKKHGCTNEFTHTYLLVSSSSIKEIILSAMTPTDSSLSIEAAQTLRLVEYFGQVAGSFGVWFGVCIFSANPTKWNIFRERKVQQTLPHRQSVRRRGAFFVKTSTLGSRLNLPNTHVGFYN